tara:strand:+ start:113 stop:610 length:498 start_codon:yes stop_codon:yes gene_type:complete
MPKHVHVKEIIDLTKTLRDSEFTSLERYEIFKNYLNNLGNKFFESRKKKYWTMDYKNIQKLLIHPNLLSSFINIKDKKYDEIKKDFFLFMSCTNLDTSETVEECGFLWKLFVSWKAYNEYKKDLITQSISVTRTSYQSASGKKKNKNKKTKRKKRKRKTKRKKDK